MLDAWYCCQPTQPQRQRKGRQLNICTSPHKRRHISVSNTTNFERATSHAPRREAQDDHVPCQVPCRRHRPTASDLVLFYSKHRRAGGLGFARSSRGGVACANNGSSRGRFGGGAKGQKAAASLVPCEVGHLVVAMGRGAEEWHPRKRGDRRTGQETKVVSGAKSGR